MPDHLENVRTWFKGRVGRFIQTIGEKDLEALIGELTAITKEAELRLQNPKFPEK